MVAVTERSGPFSKPGATGYKTMPEDRWARMARYFLGTGVMAVSFQDALNELRVSVSSGKTIAIDSGTAFIQGHWYENDDPALAITLTANTTLTTRKDLIVLELKWGPSGGVSAKCIEGTTNDVVKVADQRYGVIWQLPLAEIWLPQNYVSVTAAMIHDIRVFKNSGTSSGSTFTVAAEEDATVGGSPLMRANAGAVIPYGCDYAEDIINDAITTVSTDYGGGTVLLSEGDFKIGGTGGTDRSINILSNVNLKGMGNRTRLLYQIAGGANPVISASAQTNTTISDLYIHGGGAATYSGVAGYDGIYVLNGHSVNVTNCFIEYCKNSGVTIRDTGTASLGHLIDGNTIQYCDNYGVDISAAVSRINTNKLYANNEGLHLAGYSSTIGAEGNLISNNQVFWSNDSGIFFDGTNMCGSNHLVANTVFGSLGGLGAHIWMSGAHCIGNVIMSNFIHGSVAGYGIVLQTAVTDNRITNNDCIIASSDSPTRNLVSTNPAGTNTSPNWIRYNHSGGCSGLAGGSYDA